jgi:hypothetical protein
MGVGKLGVSEAAIPANSESPTLRGDLANSVAHNFDRIRITLLRSRPNSNFEIPEASFTHWPSPVAGTLTIAKRSIARLAAEVTKEPLEPLCIIFSAVIHYGRLHKGAT